MVQDIIKNLRFLRGDTLGEVFKKFSLYLKANNDVIASNIDDILSSFIPVNNLEKLFRLKLIDKFKKTSEMIHILEEEDIFNTTHALKCKWLFTNSDIGSGSLVGEILPYLSYSTRLKFLKRYSKCLKDTNKAEEIFKALHQRYGTECALIILPACSQSFVKETLFNTHTNLKPLILVPLFRIFPELIVEFFLFVLENKTAEKRLYRNFCFEKLSRIFVQIASKYPNRFIEMYIKHNRFFPYMRLGSRTSRRLLKTDAAIIIKHWNIFKNLLELKRIKRYMTISQLEEIQASYFPKALMQFFNQGWKLEQLGDVTSHLDEKLRQEILLRNFHKRYGKEFNVDEFSEVIDLALILLIPTVMRTKWIKSQIPTLEPESKKAEYLSYLPPEIALPALKGLIVNQKEFAVRAHIVKCMIISAKRYKDPKSLLECISFVVKRLRNDNIRVREYVFNELYEMKDLLRDLRIDEWSIIEELVNLARMNDEISTFSFYLRTILPIKIEKYYSEELPIDEPLKKFLDLFNSEESYQYDICKEAPFYKKFLQYFLSEFKSRPFQSEEMKEREQSNLFTALCEYNYSHKREMMEYPEWLLNDIENLLKSDNSTGDLCKAEIIRVIRKQPLLKNRIYFNIFPDYIDQDIIAYILRKNPLLIKQHSEKLIETILNAYNMDKNMCFLKQVSLYSFLDLPKILSDLCQEFLESDDESYTAKPNAVIVLSILLTTKEFIETINPYKPSKDEIEKYSDESILEYRIQKAVASSLKHVNTPSEILTYIKTFAVGDYLKLVVGSINSICLKVAEKKILPLLIEWLDCPVSLRKHFIRAYYKVAPVGDSGKLIVSLLAQEKNRSLRLLLLEHIYKYFLAEPSEESFDVFRAGYSQLTPGDVVAIDHLFDLKIIPDLFVAQFVKMLWEAVELKETALIKRNKTKIIQMIDIDILIMLPEELCNDLLKHCLENDSLTEFRSFITIYLLFATDETVQTMRLEKVLQHMKQMIQKDWNSFDLTRSTVFQTRSNVFDLIEYICSRTLLKEKLPISPTKLLENIKLFLLSLVPATEILDELMKLEITIFVSANNIEKDAFVNQLAKFYEAQLNKYCEEYGDQIIATVVSLMPFCLDKYRLQLAKVLLCDHTSYQTHLMGLKLVDTDINKDLPTYKSIIEFLLKCTHPYVKAAAGNILRNLNSNVHVS